VTAGVAGTDEASRQAGFRVDGFEQTCLAIHELGTDTRRRELDRNERPVAVTGLKD